MMIDDGANATNIILGINNAAEVSVDAALWEVALGSLRKDCEVGERMVGAAAVTWGGWAPLPR